MHNSSVTIGLPVRSLPEAIGWYRTVLGSRPTQQPVPHILEFALADGIRIQLVDDPELSPGDGVLRVEVKDLEAERKRLKAAAVTVSEAIRHEGSIAYFHVTDPYGNRLCVYQNLS